MLDWTRACLLASLCFGAAMVAAQGGDVSVTLSPEAARYSADGPDEDFTTRIVYQPAEHDGVMHYTPVWEPWNIYMAGGPIEGDDFYGLMSLAADPAYLQLFIANATAAPVAITSAEVVVSGSAPDLKPIIEVNADSTSRHIVTTALDNYGWGSVESAVAHFNIVPYGMEPQFGDYSFSVDIGSFETESSLDLTAAMRALGMDPEFLMQVAEQTEYEYDPANIERALGALAQTSERDEEGIAHAKAIIAGEIEFGWTDANGTPQRESVRFRIEHYFYERGGAEMGAAEAVSGEYHVELPVSGQNYLKRFPYKRVIESGATDRIVVGIRSPQSAFHTFQLRFLLSDGSELVAPPCALHFIVPRSAAESDEDYQ